MNTEDKPWTLTNITTTASPKSTIPTIAIITTRALYTYWEYPLCLSLFFKWRHRGSEKLSNLAEFAYLVNDRSDYKPR